MCYAARASKALQRRGEVVALFQLESTPPKPHGSVGRGVFLGLILDLFQIVLFPSIAIICEIIYPPSKQPFLVALMLYFIAWSLTRFLYLGPAGLC